MMNDTGITFTWLGAYCLAGLLGFLGGKVVDKILAAVLKRGWLGKTLNEKTDTVSEDPEEQYDLTKFMADQRKFKITNVDLRTDFKRK